MLQTCLNIDIIIIIYVLLGKKLRALSTCPHDFLSANMKAFFDYFD